MTASATQGLVAWLGRSLAILPARGIWPSAGAGLVYLQAQGLLATFLGALVAASIAAIRPGAHVAVWGVLWAGLNVALLWFGPGTAWALSARVTAMVLIPPALYLGLLLARRLRSKAARAEAAAAA